MRHGLLALALCLALALAGWLSHASGGALSDTARTAIDLRCDGRPEPAQRECRRLLRKLYRAGTLDPEKTLRDHCTPLATVDWRVRRPAPPALCVERYGGWRTGWVVPGHGLAGATRGSPPPSARLPG